MNSEAFNCISWRRVASGLAALAIMALLGACRDNATLGTTASDTTAPTVSITSHSDGDTLTLAPNITMSGTLSDDATISSLTVLHGGVDVTSTVSPTFDQTSFSFSFKLSPGDNALEVQATDDSANSGSSGTVNLFSHVVTGITGGQNYTCAAISTGTARCWGWGNFGRTGYDATLDIGDGTGGQAIIDKGDVNVGGTVVQVVASEFNHTCGLLDTGAVRCWGSGANGRLGHGNTTTLGSGGGNHQCGGRRACGRHGEAN